VVEIPTLPQLRRSLRRLRRIHQHQLSTKVGGLLAALSVRHWMGTLDYQVSAYDSSVDPVRHDFVGPVIAVFWHEYMLLPFYLQGRTHTAILTSQHPDADWLAESASHLGFRTVRGSTFRGGGRALLEIVRNLPDYNIGIALDGPRGPRRKMARGAVYLSSKMGIPLVPYGIGYDNPWRMHSWDRYAVPRPYSRARLVTGPRLHIPSDLDREGLEHYRQRTEDVLNRLTLEAEAWAKAGSRKINQRSMRPQAAPARCKSKSDAKQDVVPPPLPGYVPPSLPVWAVKSPPPASRVA